MPSGQKADEDPIDNLGLPSQMKRNVVPQPPQRCGTFPYFLNRNKIRHASYPSRGCPRRKADMAPVFSLADRRLCPKMRPVPARVAKW